MKIKLIHLTALSLLAAAFAFGNPGIHKKVMKELNLTDTQKEQFEKITFDAQKKHIDLKARTETSKLELRRLMSADQIDKSAIEKKMNEIAVNEVALRMNRINAWSEKNKALTPEQQKIWKKFLDLHPERIKHRTMQHRRMGTPIPPAMGREHKLNKEHQQKN